jgi:hypothetical protein
MPRRLAARLTKPIERSSAVEGSGTGTTAIPGPTALITPPAGGRARAERPLDFNAARYACDVHSPRPALGEDRV